MAAKQIAKWTLIVAILSLLSGWLWWVLDSSKSRMQVNVDDKTQSIGNIVTGNNSPITVNQQITFKIDNLNANQAQQLEMQLKNLQGYRRPFPNRPKVGIVEPYVTFVNFIDNPPHYTGLVKAGINVPLLNIGGVNAKNVITRWKIYDNGQPITSASEYFKYDPYIIDDLPSNNARKLYYNPDIGASGTGTFELVLEIEYSNANTGEKYVEQFRGITDYLTKKDSKPVTRTLTRQ